MPPQPADVLVLVDAGCSAGGRALADTVASPGIRVEVSDDPRSLCRLTGRRAVVVHREAPLHPEHADALAAFISDGGGVVALGDTLWHWCEHAVLGGGVRWGGDLPTPETELLVRPVATGPLTDRLPTELRVRSRLRRLAEAPAGGETLLRAAWRFTEPVVAFHLGVGRGTLTHVGLDSPAVIGNEHARRFLARCARTAAGSPAHPPVGIGLLGYGAIARAHAEAIGSVTGLVLRGVAEPSERRRHAARDELGVATHASADALFDDPAVDVIVVGTPPNTHTACCLDALDAGRHVVCEKPLALSLADADSMIARAEATGRTLTVYQNRRWDPDFVALHRLVRSGSIGTPFHIEAFVGGHGHPCSYWHSHQPVSGGTLFDWGSHYVDQILQLLDTQVTTVTAHAQKRLWLDVTNADQVRLEMRFADGAEASFMHSDIAAARKPKWYVLGTDAAVVGSWQAPTLSERDWAGELIETPLPPADAPARLVVYRPDGGIGTHQEAVSLAPRDRLGFYGNLAEHLLSDEPIAVTSRDMRRVIGVLDAATRSIASGGAPIAVSL
ncbi:MAG: Gfo/Idh/MocA family oxidoreductase [Candidatus Dormibacteria bacterium]